jgi:hydroxypyruvate isomerase
MLKEDVCIETVFEDLPFNDRIKKVAALGYNAIEFWFWDYDRDIKTTADFTADLNIVINNIVVNSPDGSNGGSLTKREDKAKYLDSLKRTIDLAQKLNVGKLITCTGNMAKDISREKQTANLIETLSEAVEIAETNNIVLLLEALNTYVDHAGYFLNSTGLSFDIIRIINSPHLKFLFDIYHMQIMEGNIVENIVKNISLIGHFHAAGVPGRHELFNGEINYPFIIRKIRELDYDGFFGLEYYPCLDSEVSLRETKKLFDD